MQCIFTGICADDGFHRTIESLVGQGFQLTLIDIVLHHVGVLIVGFITASEIASHVNSVLKHVHAFDRGLTSEIVYEIQEREHE